MQIEDAEFFFTHYVGCAPEDDAVRQKTQDMICHYVDSGLSSRLPDIYEACAKDSVIDTKNIPYALWADGNLVDHDAFYMHHELTLREKPPVYDPVTDEMHVFQHYRENKELYTIADVLFYARSMIRHDADVLSDSEDIGAIKHILGRYEGLKKRKIQPLDMVLFLIDSHAKECIRLIDITENEEEVLSNVESYKAKLENMGQFHIIWRGSLDG